MNLIKLLQERKKASEDAMNEYDETPEEKKARLAKAVEKSSGTYRNQ